MNNGRFRILLRRRQNQSEYPPGSGTTVNVVVNCAPLTGWAEYIPGTVDNITPFVVSDTESITPVDGWYDFTDFIEPDGINKLSFTWDKVNSGDSSNSTTNADGSNYDKGISSDLTFFDAGYRFIYNWLLSTECSILNAIEVKIIDLIARGNNPDPAGNYRIFEIKSDNIEYAPIDEPCQFHIKLREQDNVWHCIHKNFIWDNWQHWFEDSNVKTHPCFLTCIEPRPRLVQSARMALMLFLHSFPTTVIIDWITDAPTITEEARKVLNANRFVDAPLVRTYIENIAGKCNLEMDTVFDVGQVFENLCLYYPQAGFMHESDDDAAASPSLAYTFDNRWLVTIAELLDKLKVVLCAEWYVTPNNTIVFKFKKDLINLAPIYDFTLADAEPIYNLRYTFNGDKKPAYGKYEYTDDGSDLASQEMSTLYSDIVDYDGPANNPMLEGDRTKNFEFAPTGFVRDGRSKDYMELLLKDGKFGALILIGIFFVIAAFLIPGVFTTPVGIVLLAVAWAWVGDLRLKMTSLNNEFVNGPTYTGAVRLTSEQTLTPRLLLWDGISEQRAKVIQRVGLPVPNPYYNPNLTAYNVKNKIQEDNPSAIVYNYPLYFDGDFYGNLFPDYHDVIDNPLKSLETHQDVKWSVDLCDTMLNLFGVFENQYAQIGKIVKLEHRDGYDVYVRIGNISVDYDAEQINLKGTVIRRKNDSVDDPNNPGNIPVVTPEESSGAVIEPGDICLKWTNNGSEDANVAYRDCNGIHQMGVIISPEESFCAIEIYSYAGGNIVATNTCDEESGSGSGVPTPEICNKNYVANFSLPIPGDDPTIDVFENNIGAVVWTRIAEGEYRGTLAGAFPVGRTWFDGSDPITLPQGQIAYFIPAVADYVTIYLNDVDGNPSDLILGEAVLSFEIRTYCDETDACTALGLNDFTLNDGMVGIAYSKAITLSSPVDFTWITKPDWMDNEIDLEEDPDFTDVNIFGTPTDAGTFDVSFIINGCTIDTTITIHRQPAFYVQFSAHHGTVDFPNQNFGIDFSTLSAGQTGVAVWADGTIEDFTFSGTTGQRLTHTYSTEGMGVNVLFYFDNDAVFDVDLVTPYVDNGWIIGINSLSTNMGISGLHLLNVFGDLSNMITPPSAVLVDLYNVAIAAASYGAGSPAAFLDSCVIYNGKTEVAGASFVNNVLLALDANGLTGGSVDLRQNTTPAPPTGTGITAAANLVGKGWTVNTD
jgi:hypothetical protein